ncbi:MAG TPA: ABC-2 family transporter protein [Trebonia sp.]|nr:ABC-2 family transporter protein [Trebonia sp.]
MTLITSALITSMAGRWRAFRRAWWVALRISALNFQARLEYRADFVSSIFMGVVWQSSVLVFVGIVLTRFPGIGGWNAGGVLAIAAIRLLSHGIQTVVFSPLWWVGDQVGEGLIDIYLVRPLPVYRQVLLSRFPTNAIGDFAAGLLLFGLALARLQLDWTPARIGFLIAAIIGAIGVEAALATLLASLSLLVMIGRAPFQWLDSVLGSFGNYPLSALPVPARQVLTFVIPIAFVGYLPAAVLTSRAGTAGVAQWLAYGAPLVGVALYLGSRLVWYVALRKYGSAGG